MDGTSRSGLAVPLVLFLWIAGVAFAIGNVNGGGDAPRRAQPTPGPSPVPLPTEISVGTSFDETGLVADRVQRFDSGSTIAFSVWLGEPYGGDHIVVSVVRLEPEGFRTVGHVEALPSDPDSPILAGRVPADLLLEAFGPGTYLLDVKRESSERIGYGLFQLETDVPERLQIFLPGLRPVTIHAGEHTGYRFDAEGDVVEELTSTIDSDESTRSNYRATFGGRDYLFIVDGTWSNSYLVESTSVRLRE